jgi:hypothetical protein
MLVYELLLGDFLHLVYRDGAVHVHGGLVGLVAEEVLNPLGAEALLLEVAGAGVAEDMGVEVCARGPIKCFKLLRNSSSIMGMTRVLLPFPALTVARLRSKSISRMSRATSSCRRSPSHHRALVRVRSRKLVAARMSLQTSDGRR